jgi:tetratricopeptide (TPR) repeat protein
LLKGNWEAGVSAATDRLAVLMLAALSGEKKNPDAAINAYRLAIREAKEVHDLPLVVPAYLRLAEVLVNMSRTDEALALIQEFEARYPREGKTRPYDPTETQRGLIAIKKSRLKTASVGRRA